ncbi:MULTISPECIES: bifunctional UDP-sugar hydrolase/5'-nucleotidase UshA [Pseudoalteromonas]|uniref:Bifunctional UDP-sugar hydrolase/5'-nucleotidase n=1 Tax=Pseudoalteromonas amylolytica TaxID=1859457 RepID=A0A1S1N054_9GAMM|nr:MULTISPECIES: bifunctional UDP-sugar hydrolase/5'-nucleotidase UshA [Pseudoalteromonas]OHU85356.1 bifunctional UDP-sugar hydrolase/5'-nucleotidase [Pseudoalteromonas sp. JW3]OHU93023.1 bifunctional UDP-sugar hydrolase/5'-nucleotidase [Pseudoalteromonas amylolytica]
MRILLSVLLCIFLSSCQLTSNREAQYLTVLHTNDNHGRFWHNEKGEYGMAARKTLIDRLKNQADQNGHAVILLSGGDINTGIPESDLQFAEPDFKGMSLLGYDAMAIGNHEFDNPLHVLEKQQQWANFPLLSANILHANDRSHAYQPYTLIEKQGLKIAVVGLTTTDTAKIANPEYLGDLVFVDPAEIVESTVAAIKASHDVNVVIAVTHMGHYHDANFGINAPGDVTLARSIAPDTLDMIIGGHSQEPVCVDAQGRQDKLFAPGKACKPDKQNGVWIMQAHEWGKYVGKAEFKIENGIKTLISYELIPVNLKNNNGEFVNAYIEPDAKMKALLQPYQAFGEKKLKGSVGFVDGYLDGKRNTVRFKQSKLASLIIKAQMAAVGADFGLISGGGIRHSIEAGDVSYKDILKVHPFKNRITLMQWQGDELYKYLNTVTRFPPDSGAYLQYYGLSFDYSDGKLSNVMINGKPLDFNATYKMSINSYNASGGDGYPTLVNMAGYKATNLTDAQVLKQYLQTYSPIKVNLL